MKYKLVYTSNVVRKTICYFECDNDPYETAKKYLNKYGIKYDAANGHFYKKTESDESSLIIVYSEVVAPYGAVRLFRKNGFDFIIRPNEKNHINTAHIHVQWADGEITVILDDYSVRKSNGTKSQDERRAVKIIKEYAQQFNDAWYEIIENHNLKKAKAIFDKLE